MIMKRVKTTDNSADAMTKQTGRQLFYRHFDFIMGRIPPHYVKATHSQSQKQQISTIMTNTDNILVNCDSPKSLKFSVLTNKEGISHIGE